MSFASGMLRAGVAGLLVAAGAAGTARADDLVAPKLDSLIAFCAGQCSASVFVGPRFDTPMAKVFGIAGYKRPWEYTFGDGAFLGGTFSKQLYRYDDLWRLEGEVGVGKRFGRLNEGEAWVAIYGRWTWFPWNHVVRTSVAVSTGLNIATAVPKFEAHRSGVKDAYLLHYLSPEITFGLPDRPDWDGFLRLHHRSGGGDFLGGGGPFKGASGGVQALVVGFRKNF